jgi:hypothetical protein
LLEIDFHALLPECHHRRISRDENAAVLRSGPAADPICLFFKDVAMRWFNKHKPEDVWDEAIQWPIGDIEAAHRIRDICRAAVDSAEKVAGFAGRPENKKNKYEAERYERAARTAMEIAMKMADDLLRDSSVRQIVSLCMKASDLKTARILLRAIQAASIRDDVLNEHPTLRQ